MKKDRDRNFPHLNGCLLCAVDLETTGLKPGYHETWQVAIVPLDENIEPRDDLPVFDIYIKPDHPERRPEYLPGSGERFVVACQSGLDQLAAADLFDDWYRRLNLGEKRRIIPLAQNWAQLDLPFLKAWLGPEHVNTYFDARVRDLMGACNFINDYNYFNGKPIKFVGAKALSLAQIASKMGVDTSLYTLHDALNDCMLTAVTYKALMTEVFTL